MKAIATIKNLVTSKAGLQLLKAQKHAPVILFTAGVVGVVGTVVLACRATLKMDEIVDDTQNKLHRINTRAGLNSNYTEEMAQRDKTIVVVKASVNIAKQYAPAFGLGVLAVAALTGSHVILTNRNVALGASLAAVTKGFEGYRQRVVDAYGVDKDYEFLYNMEDGEIVEKDKDGNEKKVKTKAIGSSVNSPYTFLFDDVNSSEWNPDHGHNQMYISCQQQYANDRLRADGYLFLNDVLVSLGLPRTKIGQMAGWVVGKGDDKVDFGVFRGRNLDSKIRFVNGDERSIWLDFNCVGNILDEM